MSIGIKVYQTRDFVRKNAKGTIDLERSLEEVRQLAQTTHYFQDHNILLDLRETVVDGDRADTLRVAAAFAQYFKSFRPWNSATTVTCFTTRLPCSSRLPPSGSKKPI